MKKSELKQLIEEVISENQNEKEYKEKVINFLDYPWQEDSEIEFVNLVNQYRNKILNASIDEIKRYLQ